MSGGINVTFSGKGAPGDCRRNSFTDDAKLESLAEVSKSVEAEREAAPSRTSFFG